MFSDPIIVFEEAEETEEYWLVGRSFTAADITATVLMLNLRQIAIAARFFSAEKRPIVYEYYNRLFLRPSVQKMVAVNDSTQSYVIKQVAKSYCKKALKVGVIIGLVAICFVGYKEYSRIHKGLTKA